METPDNPRFISPTPRPYVVLDTETTGLYPPDAELLEIGIVGADGLVLFHTYLTPERNTTWPDAEQKNGISPKFIFTGNFPRLADVRDQLIEVLRGKDVVIYNAGFDSRFLDAELREAGADCYDCMEPFAEIYGDWNEYYENYRWQKLTTAARYVDHTWQGAAHGAVADALATLDVWRYLTQPAFRADVETSKAARREAEEIERCVARILDRERLREEAMLRHTHSDVNVKLRAWLGIEDFLGNGMYVGEARRSAEVFCKHLTGYDIDTWEKHGAFRLGLPRYVQGKEDVPPKLLDEWAVYWLVSNEKRPKPVAMLQGRNGLRGLFRPHKTRCAVGIHYVPYSSGAWPGDEYYSETTLLRTLKIGKKAFRQLRPAYRRRGKDFDYYLYHYIAPTSAVTAETAGTAATPLTQ